MKRRDFLIRLLGCIGGALIAPFTRQNRTFRARIDKVKVYNYPLSAAEIKTIYLSERHTF